MLIKSISFIVILFFLTSVNAKAQTIKPNEVLSKIKPGENLYLGNYNPPVLDGCSKYGYSITDYSRFTYDSKRNAMVMFGGGHASIPRTDVDVLDLNLTSLAWKSDYPSTKVSEQVLANFDYLTGSWKTTGHPSSRHTYDMLTYAPNVGELVLLEMHGAQPACGSVGVKYYKQPGKVWHYSSATKRWSKGGDILWFNEYAPASEYDPQTGKIVVITRYGMYLYDPVARVSTQVMDFSRFDLFYAQNLIYFPPNQKMYYMINNGDVFEVTLDRNNYKNSTIIKMTGITGNKPPLPLPGDQILGDQGETGFAYDMQNKIIGGGVWGGVFYAFDPLSKKWSSSKLTSNIPGVEVGSVSIMHMIDYSSVDNAFIFMTRYRSAAEIKYSLPEHFSLWAYKYKPEVTVADTTPPTSPSMFSATAKSESHVDLSWNASTDNVGVAGYRIYRNAALIANVGTNVVFYSDTGLTSDTVYTYTVIANDVALNSSVASSPVNVRTAPRPIPVKPAPSDSLRLVDGQKRGTTWTHIDFPSTKWTNAGGDWRDKKGVLQGNVPWAIAKVIGNNTQQTLSFNVTDLVKSHLAMDNSKILNRGWIIKWESGNTVFLFNSREGIDPNKAPKLNIITTAGVYNLPVGADVAMSPSTYNPILSLSPSVEIGGTITRGGVWFDLSSVKGSVQKATLVLTTTIRQYGAGSSIVGIYPVDLGSQGGSTSPIVYPSPIVRLTSSPTMVNYRASAVLSWVSKNAISCQTPWGSTATSGDFTTAPLLTDTTFLVTCSGQGGSNSSSVVVFVVKPAPTVSLSVADAKVAYNASTTLTWGSTNADSCKTSWGATAMNGIYTTPSLLVDTMYSITCKGSGGSTLSSLTVRVLPPPSTPLLTGKYRSNQQYLFQTVPAKVILNRIKGGSDFYWDIFGPTYRYVDFRSGWLWTHPGGDWIDSNLVSQGKNPWFSIPTDSGVPLKEARTYHGDVTKAIAYCFTSAKWCAFILDERNAARSLATSFDPFHAAPTINVVYKNGIKDTLKARILAVNSSGSVMPATTFEKLGCPMFIEFDKPQFEVASASLSFVVVEHWSGNNSLIQGFLLDPPLNTAPIQQGLAASAGVLDDNITSLDGVIGAHRYVDGTQYSDFINPVAINMVERNFDPAIYGTGAKDITKVPYWGAGKWFNPGKNWSIVPSSFSGEGFKPLAPGLGALRLNMKAEPGVVDGSVVGYSGTIEGDGNIFLPEPLFGNLDHIFIRYYFRMGTPYQATVANRKQVYHEAKGSSDWTSYAGKWGIVPDHSTGYGGYSGSSGGGEGWEMRNSWYETDAGTGGPDEGGWSVGFHLYDFYYQNPKGYNYGGGDPIPAGSELWGQKGGLNILYAGKWYCVETELKLNTIKDTSPGFLPDGVLRTWIDGRLAYESTGMVFRTKPKVYAANSENLRPVRSLGIRNIKLNWFHGGKTFSTFDRTNFYTGLVWSTKYIGPMKLDCDPEKQSCP